MDKKSRYSDTFRRLVAATQTARLRWGSSENVGGSDTRDRALRPFAYGGAGPWLHPTPHLRSKHLRKLFVRAACVIAALAITSVSPVAAQADTGIAYNAVPANLVSDASIGSWGYEKCQTKQVHLAAGWYLVRNFDRNVIYSSSGPHTKTFQRDLSYYLAAGDYIWTDCFRRPYEDCTVKPWCDYRSWQHDTALTRVTTNGVVRNDVSFRNRGTYQRIVEWGSVLFAARCDPNADGLTGTARHRRWRG